MRFVIRVVINAFAIWVVTLITALQVTIIPFPPGETLQLVLDLLAHGEEWVRDRLQHVHLGFTEADLKQHIEAAGFEHVAIDRAARDPQPPHLMTLLATGTVASATEPANAAR